MSGENELKPGKPSPGLAPAYCAIYPDVAALVRKHGYALSIHGSLRRDFDLVCVPWADEVSTPEQVVEAITSEFAFTRDKYPTQKNHGRICYTIHISWGECRFDLSFVNQIPVCPPGTETAPEGTMDLLKSMEWSMYREWDDCFICPVCKEPKRKFKHNPNCKLSAILTAHRERTAKPTTEETKELDLGGIFDDHDSGGYRQ